MAIKFFDTEENLCAILVKSEERVETIEFFSPEWHPQQLGLMSRPSGYKVPAHVHNLVKREIHLTQEVLVVRAGSCVVRLFGNGNKVIEEIVLKTGDTILLAFGAHEIEMLSDCEILEIKQGPYSQDADKKFI